VGEGGDEVQAAEREHGTEMLATLHARFVSGPIDWKKVFGESAAPSK